MNVSESRAKGITMDVNRIMELIPHRHPFLMIDRLVDMVPDVSVTCIKNVTINEDFFRGHFPSEPVMPGVLIIEAMAQTAAVFVIHTLGPDAEGKLVYFMSIENARFRRPVRPGDQLVIHAVKVHRRNNVWKCSAEAMVDGEVVAEALYTALIRDR